MIKRYLIGAGIAGAFILAYGLAGNGDIAEEQRQRDTYCEMVDLWAKTGGDAGWPPYRENLDCEE
jgi:hypothetical protein